MGTTSGGLALPFPDDGVTAKGPDATRLLAEAVEAAYLDSSVSVYTPAWTADGLSPTSPASVAGRYRVRNGICDVAVVIIFGGSTTGGTGPLRVSLPVPASSVMPEQNINCQLWIPSTGTFWGQGSILAGATVARPVFPATAGNTQLYNWASADLSAAIATGYPTIPGNYTVQNGGNFAMTGRYLV